MAVDAELESKGAEAEIAQPPFVITTQLQMAGSDGPWPIVTILNNW